MASLESVRLGFQFDDKTFINVSTESDNYRRIKDGQNGLYYANRLISEVSERFGLKLNPDASLLQIHEGGLCPAETVDGQLYVIESIDTIEDTSPQPTKSCEKSCEKSRENDEAEGFSWKHSSVLLLLETYRAHKNDFSSSTKRKNDIWKRIAQEMEETGYTVKPLQCEKKWSNLKIRYKKIVDSNNKTGRGHQTWAYFDAMQELLHNDPSVTAPVTVSSLNGKKVEVMPNGVDGEYRILYYVDSTDRDVDTLPATTRTHTLTGLQPNSFYSLKLTSIYAKRQRKTKTFIFKTAKDRNDVQITSSSDASEATSYTLTWSVDDYSGDVPVKAFNLNFKRVEVMPDRVGGEYRLRRNLDLTDRSVDNLPLTTRAYTLTGLQPNSFYILTLTTIYGNLHSQRMTNTFIFKTAEVQTEDQSYAAYHTHEYENGVNPSLTNSHNGYITESSDNYQIEHIADPTDNRFLDNRIGSQGVLGAVRMSDSDNNRTVYSYSDPPPSYYEATKTSNTTETTI